MLSTFLSTTVDKYSRSLGIVAGNVDDILRYLTFTSLASQGTNGVFRTIINNILSKVTGLINSFSVGKWP